MQLFYSINCIIRFKQYNNSRLIRVKTTDDYSEIKQQKSATKITAWLSFPRAAGWTTWGAGWDDVEPKLMG